MDKEKLVNMGMVCRGWLVTQQKDKVHSLFVGPLVTRLCLALGYKAKMDWFDYRIPEAQMAPMSLDEVTKLKLT